MKVTVKEFAAKQGIEVLMAGAVLNFLKARGEATIVETRKPEGGKGKPSNVYEIPESVTITL